MWRYKLLFVLVLCLLHTSPVLSQWACVQNSDCADVQGSVCNDGACVCPTGLQIGLSGSTCIELAPYHTSACVEDHQCSRLFTSFECRRQNQTDERGACSCQPGHHYFHGRCWPTSDFNTPCTRDEHCITLPRNPYSLQCEGVCVCAAGYYERQRGECRKIGYAVGDGCVINQDCQFTNGVCDINTLRCIDSTASRSPASLTAVNVTAPLTAVISARSHGVACNIMSPCPAPLECSTFGACVCPVGYYLSDNGLQCNAELGSQSTPEQCAGLLAQVIDGVCTCPPNFFFEENMRDCVKVTRRITDSCVSDENCHTFGAAARCGDPADWGLRNCECDPELAVWEDDRQMCRLFAGIGEACEVDSDCLAGEFEIQCVAGTCACPEGLTAFEGLCITTGLELGDACQVSAECTETPNTVCAGGRCSCGEGYQELDDFCAAVIGGSCTVDDECMVENTVCVNDTLTSLTRHGTLTSLTRHDTLTSLTRHDTLTSLTNEARDGNQTCQCRQGFVAEDDICWTVAPSYAAQCNVTSQCTVTLGFNAVCVDHTCTCLPGHHHRDRGCWPMTGLFESCSRTSQCYLSSMSERTVCRNSICQCAFEYLYSEELRTCLYSSASGILGSTSVIILALTYLILY